MTVMHDVVALVLQRNVFVPVPPLGVAHKLVEPPAQNSGLFKETVGFGFTVAFPDPDPVQPFSSVTVTE